MAELRNESTEAVSVGVVCATKEVARVRLRIVRKYLQKL